MNQAPDFRRIALIAKPDAGEELRATLRRAVEFLDRRGLAVCLDAHAAQALARDDGLPLDALGERCDLAVIVGGDGTFLNAARELGTHDIPLLGVNLGRLGFLVDISPDAMCATLGEMLDGRFEEEHRFLLSCRVGDGPACLALNDVVLHKWNTARMIEFETRINGRYVDSQRSDGIIVSTPTGSTAYALSGGGPLLEPSLDAIILVPICPHHLSNRPIVVHGDSEICIEASGRTDPNHLRVTCDGQSSLTLEEGEHLEVRKYPRPIRLFHPLEHDHFTLLRAKLGWGGRP